ncbi:PEP-CTERM sorting domain-containing protein [Verrucomicrobium spinosum]|uniref:PEP-CTERM sorting domain-containing protein n=1 Tax=Verrucomicrobium spinosum TaxID=2736 RepID=UPI000174586E|nr:PEP-CTERM sorting domain-containing protein [Verrucomicrobium spinosum]
MLPSRSKIQHLALFALTFLATAWAMPSVALAGTIISFNPQASTGGLMTTTYLAGAPGVRVGYWNNFNESNLVLDAADSMRYDDGTLVGGSFTMTFNIPASQGLLTNRTSNTTNDPQMFNGVVDVYSATASTAAFSNIPFETYDIYVYMRNDGANRIGGFTIGGTTYYARGTGVASDNIPGTDGSGYVLSTDTTIIDGTDSSVDQGNYVRFSNLTGSSQILSLFAADGSTGVERNKVAGFQIVATPEPSRAVLLMLGGVLLLTHRHRRAK